MHISAVSLDIPGLATSPTGEEGLPPEANGEGFQQAMLKASLAGLEPHGNALPLKAVAMGTVQLITTNTPAPEVNDLQAFAAAQGLSPEALALLFGKNNPLSAPTPAGASTENIDSEAGQPVQADPDTDTEAALALLGAMPLGLAHWAPLTTAPTTATPISSAEPNVLPAGWQSTQALLSAGGKAGATNPAAASGEPPIPEEVMDLLDLDPETRELLNKLGLLDKDAPSGKAATLGLQNQAQQAMGTESRTPLDTLQRPTLLAGQGMAAPTAALAENATPADRAAQIQALAEKIGQALSQRIMGQIERGQWQVKLLLRPAGLGEVEVDLRLRAGELDATLRAMNPLTRELLTEGLPRLREGLSQAGMDVAQLHVGTGESSRNGGNPTPREFARQPEQTGSGTAQASAGDKPAETRVSQRTGGADGWDVMV
jgi:flagellar hook-length control protein FliK